MPMYVVLVTVKAEEPIDDAGIGLLARNILNKPPVEWGDAVDIDTEPGDMDDDD